MYKLFVAVLFVITIICSSSGTQIDIELFSSEDFLVRLIGFFTTDF